MRPDQLERLEARLDAPADSCVEVLHVVMLPGVERPERIGEFGDYPESRDLDELLIDGKEDQILNDRD